MFLALKIHDLRKEVKYATCITLVTNITKYLVSAKNPLENN